MLKASRANRTYITLNLFILFSGCERFEIKNPISNTCLNHRFTFKICFKACYYDGNHSYIFVKKEYLTIAHTHINMQENRRQ